MPEYSYKCPACKAKRSVVKTMAEATLPVLCDNDAFVMLRDYAADFGSQHHGDIWNKPSYALGVSPAEVPPMEKFDKGIELNNLAPVHANDAKVEFGSGIDRDENIGEGHIGVTGFEVIMANPAFRDVPFLLEVPGTDKKGPDREQLDRVKDIRVRMGAT